jgi:hypothetical protein
MTLEKPFRKSGLSLANLAVATHAEKVGAP